MRLQFPWETDELILWDIVGMNHHYCNDNRYLFVSMVKGGRCIKAEGEEVSVWRSLERQSLLEKNNA